MNEVMVLGMSVGELAGRAVALGLAVAVAAVLSHLLTKLLRRVLNASSVPSASIFVNLGRALVWACALLGVMKPVLGIEPTGVVTALGVTSLAISLGMQDTISNVVGGLALMAGKVVQPGDLVEVSGFSGEVIDVTWRSTTVRDRLGNEQVIPNSVLTKTALKRLSRGSATLCELDIVVRHGADLDAVAQQIVDAADQALAGRLVEGMQTGVCFVSSDAYGIGCAVYLHVIDGISLGAARDALMRKIGGAPWLARA